MTKPSEIADQIVQDGDIESPELIKVDVQVRTGGHILPPSWLSRRDRAVERKRSTNTPAERN